VLYRLTIGRQKICDRSPKWRRCQCCSRHQAWSHFWPRSFNDWFYPAQGESSKELWPHPLLSDEV